ncbi:MAG: hypothetical protein H6Q00_2027 [Holophagaceae bacterium]|nr:hypothetical protein [Holophagaceae bacterium]
MKTILEAPEAERQQRLEMFNSLRNEIWSRQMSNSESYDRNLLSLATLFLGLSLTFLKDISCYPSTTYRFMLSSSWGLFALAVVCTIGSILTSQAGLNRRLEDAEQYYIEGSEDHFNKRNSYAVGTRYLNKMSAISFISAIVLTVWFVIINLPGGKMNSNDRLERGAPVPSIQKVPGQSPAAGVEIPTMQKVPQPSGGQPSSGEQSNKK